MRPARLFSVLLAAFFVAACSGGRQLESVLWPETGGEYYPVVKKWTRVDESYTGMEGQVSAVATLKTREWRRAYTREKSALFHWDEEKKERFARTMQENAKKNTEFFLAVHGSDKDHAQLEYNSQLWEVFLNTADGERVYPLGIREVETPLAEQVHFFPYVNRWKKTYTLTFPKVREQGVSLIITGPAGKLALNW
ncbi:MAG: hypothetical protein ACLFSY_08395 [Desulfonatronovibrionaceae bacterium]